MPAPETAPEPWVQTPGFLQDRGRRVHLGLMNLNDEITRLATAGRLSTTSSRWAAWKALLAAFGTWYQDASWMWSGTAATLDHYESEIANWQQWLRQVYPDVAPQLVAPPTRYNPDGRPATSPFLPLAIGAAGALALVLLLRK